MWRACEQTLDEPAKFWFLGMDDVVLFVVLLLGTGLLMDTLLSLAVAVGGTAAIYWGKRGRPPGFLLHRLHSWEFCWFRLPGVLPPRPTTYSPW